MECLQYDFQQTVLIYLTASFKPCYKWNAFNTTTFSKRSGRPIRVLNLVISGMPSILLQYTTEKAIMDILCFKPCYKWNAFNTGIELNNLEKQGYSFKPCYKWNAFNTT